MADGSFNKLGSLTVWVLIKAIVIGPGGSKTTVIEFDGTIRCFATDCLRVCDARFLKAMNHTVHQILFMKILIKILVNRLRLLKAKKYSRIL